jgi:hypothetical protein
MYQYFDMKNDKHKKIEGIFRQSSNAARLTKLQFFLTFHEYSCLKEP